MDLYLYDDIMPEGIRAIFEALMRCGNTKGHPLGYPCLKDIRIWKCQARDEGARVIAKFLKQNSACRDQVLQCDLMGNFITKLGCEFFGQALAPAFNTSLKTLKLDHNPIGWEGLG